MNINDLCLQIIEKQSQILGYKQGLDLQFFKHYDLDYGYWKLRFRYALENNLTHEVEDTNLESLLNKTLHRLDLIIEYGKDGFNNMIRSGKVKDIIFL